MKIIEDLGNEVEKRWASVDHDERRFPEICAAALAEFQVQKELGIDDLIREFATRAVLPEQKDLYAKFGDPPLTLFAESRFHIDVYFWFEGTTSIHQHGFCGAFQVIHGSSIHSHYEFLPRREVSSFCRIGEMRLLVSELLGVGDIQTIDPGAGYIHSLYHLEHPSATLIIRTSRSALELPQFSYLKPGLAVDPFYEEPGLIKRGQLLAAAVRAGIDSADQLVEDVLASADLFYTYRMLNVLRPHLVGGTVESIFGLPSERITFGELLEKTSRRFGADGEVLISVFKEIERSEKLVGLRNSVRDEELRFMLALLLNVPDREHVLKLISSRFPNAEPRDQLYDLLSRLVNTKVIGGKYKNGLDLEGFGDFELLVLEEMMDGKSSDEVVESLGNDAVDSKRVEGIFEKIGSAAVLEPLLKGGA